MLKIAFSEARSNDQVLVIVEGENPAELDSPEVRKLALAEGSKFSANVGISEQGSAYPVDALGAPVNDVDIFKPLPPGVVFRRDIVLQKSL